MAEVLSQGADDLAYANLAVRGKLISRGKVAIYNENLRAIAARYDCVVADLWALNEIRDPRMWAPDRLHLNALGHHTVARMTLAALNVPNSLEPRRPEPMPGGTWRRARTEDLAWARDYLVPWVLRRVRHQSSGDDVPPKRPEAAPLGHQPPRVGV